MRDLYTTISKGRLHVALDQHYLGNVKVYNNRLVAFFARLFKFGWQIDCNGKKRTLNSKDYIQFLIPLLSQDARAVPYRALDSLKETLTNASLSQANKKMQEAIDPAKRQRLFKKLAGAIASGDQERACKLIGKGAALEIPFFHREGLSPAFHSDAEGLRDSKYQFKVIKGTPILVAAVKGQKSVVAALARQGALKDKQCEMYTFSKEITGVHYYTNYSSLAIDHFIEITYNHHRTNTVKCVLDKNLMAQEVESKIVD